MTEHVAASRQIGATGPLQRASAAWPWLIPAAPWLAAVFAFVRAVAEPHALLNDPDTYLHIAAGRWMVAHVALPTLDPFSFSLPGAAWIPNEWLAELILAATHGVAGWNGIVLLTAVCFAAAAGLLAWFAMPRLGPLPAMIVAVAGVALVLPHLLARPHILSLPLLVAWSGLLLRARDEGRAPPWAVLPLIVVWANLHASMLFGVALAGFLAAEAVLIPGPARSRRAELLAWGGFAVLAALLAVVTPNGVPGIVQPFRLMAMPALRASFGEWRPADLATFTALEIWVLGVLVLGLALRPRLRWTRVALLVVLLHMALVHVRHADLLGLVGPLVIAAGAAPALRARIGRGAAESGAWDAIGAPRRWVGPAVALTLATAVSWPLLERPLVRTDDPVTPASALSAARRLGLRGPVFNAESFGGYLVFSGVPDFIDGRVEMYGNDFLAAEVAAEGGDAASLTRLLKRFRIGWTLLPPDAAGVVVLDGLPGWSRVYADQYAVIHMRTASAD